MTACCSTCGRPFVDMQTPEETLADVAKLCGVTVADLLGRSREQQFTKPRFEAYWRLRKSGYRLTVIARMFGRDHATIIHGIRKFDWRLARSATLRARLGVKAERKGVAA